MRNQRGIAPIFIILAIVAVVGTGAYILLSNSSSSFLQKNKLTNSQEKDLENAKIDLQEFAIIIETAQGMGLDSDQMDALVDSVVQERKDQIKEEAAKILAKDTCEALMIDIENALTLASEAWAATDEETGNALWEWAREAFRGYVVDASMAVGATFLEQDIDLFALSYEERKVLYAQAREKFYDRALLAQQAQLFGFEDIHTKILKGEFLEPVCVQLWNIKTELEYDWGDNVTTKSNWVAGAELKDVPIYKYHPKMGLPVISENSTNEGYLEVKNMWWREASDSPVTYPYTKENDPWWTVRVSYEENTDDFWQDELVIESKVDISKTQASLCNDYFGCAPLREVTHNGFIKFKVPALKLWNREAFVQEEEKEDVDEEMNEKIITRVEFTPSKRVRVEQLN